MNAKSILKTALLACLLAGAEARADVTAVASLSNLHVILVDLRPDDGIAPSVSFAGSDDIISYSLPTWDVQYAGTTPFSPLAYANSNANSSSSVSIASDPVTQATTLTAISSAR